MISLFCIYVSRIVAHTHREPIFGTVIGEVCVFKKMQILFFNDSLITLWNFWNNFYHFYWYFHVWGHSHIHTRKFSSLSDILYYAIWYTMLKQIFETQYGCMFNKQHFTNALPTRYQRITNALPTRYHLFLYTDIWNSTRYHQII